MSIDSKICQGHGLCVAAVPAIFAMDEREHAVVHSTEIPSELEGAVRRAAVSCPEDAITINEQ